MTVTTSQRRARPTGRRRAVRIVAAAGVVLATLGAVSRPRPAYSASPPQNGSAIVSPNSALQNREVVTVGWTGFAPTLPPNPRTGVVLNEVVILECVANPPGGHYAYFRDCATNDTPGNGLGGDGNRVDGVDLPGAYGVTAGDGSGAHPFQVEGGTIHNSTTACEFGSNPPCDSPNNIQCDIFDPCVIKVFTNPAPGTIPDGASWEPIGVKGTYDYALDHSPGIVLSFGAIPSCPPTGSSNVSLEGAASAASAIQSWAAALCLGPNPVTLSYADIGETSAKGDFLAKNTDMALAAIPPSAADVAAVSGASSFAAAPLDAGGVSIAFAISDAVTRVPVATVRLTPRLVAMLITNSGTLDLQNTIFHTAAYSPHDTVFRQPLTDDPEFMALNPPCQTYTPQPSPPGCFTPPKGPDFTTSPPSKISLVEEPLLRAENNDDTFVLTNWIAQDFDARRFLAGQDPCGAKLNQWWQGVSYPTSKFDALEQGRSGQVNGQDNVGTVFADYYQPVTGTGPIIQDLLYQIAPGFTPSIPPTRVSALSPFTTASFAVLDAVSARRSGFHQAQLRAANPTASELNNYVTFGPGGCTVKAVDPIYPGVVGPSDAGLAAGYQAMAGAPRPDGTLVSPVATTDPTAYPLAKIDYAFVPTSGLSLPTANLIATTLRYTAGPGQVAPALPNGYPPLPASLASQALAVADKVVQAATPGPAPAPSTQTTTAPSVPSTPSTPSVNSGNLPPGDSGTTGTSGSPGSGTAPSPSPTGPAGAAPGPAGANQLALQGPVDVKGAASVAGGWLLPMIAILGAISGLAAAALRRRAQRAGPARPIP